MQPVVLGERQHQPPPQLVVKQHHLGRQAGICVRACVCGWVDALVRAWVGRCSRTGAAPPPPPSWPRPHLQAAAARPRPAHPRAVADSGGEVEVCARPLARQGDEILQSAPLETPVLKEHLRKCARGGGVGWGGGRRASAGGGACRRPRGGVAATHPPTRLEEARAGDPGGGVQPANDPPTYPPTPPTHLEESCAERGVLISKQPPSNVRVGHLGQNRGWGGERGGKRAGRGGSGGGGGSRCGRRGRRRRAGVAAPPKSERLGRWSGRCPPESAAT